jgi:polyketide biosynthesis acyl carrier protein
MKKEDLFELIVNHTCQVIPKLKEHRFQPEDRLKDLGANSLDRTEIIDMVMESLSLQTPRVEIFGAKKTIGELVDILYEKN